MSARHTHHHQLPGGFASGPAYIQDIGQPAGSEARAPESIALRAANLLYEEARGGNGLAGACRFVEFLRQQGVMEKNGQPIFGIDDLTAMVRLAAESPAEEKAAVLRLIASLLPAA